MTGIELKETDVAPVESETPLTTLLPLLGGAGMMCDSDSCSF
jgi:hypothetical protein